MHSRASAWRRGGTLAAAGAWLAAALVSAQAPAGWTPPRTPWGDPDIQGNYTNKYEQGTPFERPAEFAGRRLEEIPAEERARLVRQRADQVLLNSPFTGGDPVAGNFGGAPAFYDRFEANKGSRLWFVVDPPDGQIPPMSPEGERASAARAAARAARRAGRGPSDSHEDRSLYDRCITRGLPGSMMPANYGNSYRIVQAPGFVAITYEMVHETRVIPLDGRSRLAPAIRQHMGDARGHWEGDTLVVETTNLVDGYRGANPDTTRYIERFTATSPDQLEWAFTVDDGSTWTRPWTFAMPLTRSDEEAIFEYACHEGNRAMTNLLAGARAEEAAPHRGTAAPAVVAARGEPVVPGVLEPAEMRSPLAGVWILDGTTGGGGRGNFAGYATASRMVIRHRAAEVTVETNTGTQNQLTAAVFRLDGSENAVPGPLGWETKARAVLRDGKLVVSVTRAIEGAQGPITFQIEDVYRVKGDVLTLERTQGSESRTMTYRRF